MPASIKVANHLLPYQVPCSYFYVFFTVHLRIKKPRLLNTLLLHRNCNIHTFKKKSSKENHLKVHLLKQSSKGVPQIIRFKRLIGQHLCRSLKLAISKRDYGTGFSVNFTKHLKITFLRTISIQLLQHLEIRGLKNSRYCLATLSKQYSQTKSTFLYS